MVDYVVFYDRDRYLFETVGPRFQRTGSISTFDFFSIVIWKANRAKSKIARKLIKKASSLDAAVASICQALRDADDDHERMRVLFQDWGFRLPMASAILTVLWPDSFTVYDVRVCDQLDDFGALGNRVKFETMWTGYREYVEAVRRSGPARLCLRDKDRWLWGRSAATQAAAGP